MDGDRARRAFLGDGEEPQETATAGAENFPPLRAEWTFTCAHARRLAWARRCCRPGPVSSSAHPEPLNPTSPNDLDHRSLTCPPQDGWLTQARWPIVFLAVNWLTEWCLSRTDGVYREAVADFRAVSAVSEAATADVEYLWISSE